jgi:uncharacterized protein with ATP-grasp and redox domains
VIKKVLKELENINYSDSPAFNSNYAYHIFTGVTGIKDPFYNMKINHNKAAIELYSRLENMVLESDNNLKMAARAAVAGNVIDLGTHLMGKNTLKLEEILEEIIKIPLARDDYSIFASDLEKAEKILYIADNAGEIVFDRLFISQILKKGKTIILAVKSGPIINDATVDDVRQAGLDGMVKVVETGNNCIGINFKQASDEFMKEFKGAHMIISKGQGNFESLDEIKSKKIFFLLKAKCEKIARELGVNYLDVVFMKSRFYQ